MALSSADIAIACHAAFKAAEQQIDRGGYGTDQLDRFDFGPGGSITEVGGTFIDTLQAALRERGLVIGPLQP